MSVGASKNITLILNGQKYDAKIQCSRPDSKETKIRWNASLSIIINQLFPLAENDDDYRPDMIFKKINEIEYELLLQLDNCPEPIELLSNFVYEDEGRKIPYYGLRYERSKKNREKTIEKYKATCQVCGFNFGKVYGSHGYGFIEVHHIEPLSSIGENANINPEDNLICLCSNCHRMIHRNKNKPLSIEELREIFKTNNPDRAD